MSDDDVTVYATNPVEPAKRRVIAVDLDGTLAVYDVWRGEEHVGEPIAPMVERVRRWLDAGHDVRIFTARAFTASAVPPIERWCAEHLGRVLPVTNVKRHDVNEIWDDRAVQVERNTGRVVGVEPNEVTDGICRFCGGPDEEGGEPTRSGTCGMCFYEQRLSPETFEARMKSIGRALEPQSSPIVKVPGGAAILCRDPYR